MNLVKEFLRWRQSRPPSPKTRPDRVEVETHSGGVRVERRYRHGESAPYFELTFLPAGENWLPKFTEQELAVARRDIEEDRRLGRFIDL